MGAVEGDVEGRVVADAEPQLLRGVGGVFHGQGVVDRPALQPEGAGEDEVKGEALGLGGGVGPQLQLDGIALGAEQGVLHVPRKAVLAALVGLAAMGEGAAGQLARPREEMGAWRFQTAGSACQSSSSPAAFFRLTASAPWVSTVRVRNSLWMVVCIVVLLFCYRLTMFS